MKTSPLGQWLRYFSIPLTNGMTAAVGLAHGLAATLLENTKTPLALVASGGD